MAELETSGLVPSSESDGDSSAALVREVDMLLNWILGRNHPPAEDIVGEGNEGDESSEDDVLDLTIAAARLLTAGPERFSLDDVLVHFGYSGEDLAALPDAGR